MPSLISRIFRKKKEVGLKAPKKKFQRRKSIHVTQNQHEQRTKEKSIRFTRKKMFHSRNATLTISHSQHDEKSDKFQLLAPGTWPQEMIHDGLGAIVFQDSDKSSDIDSNPKATPGARVPRLSQTVDAELYIPHEARRSLANHNRLSQTVPLTPHYSYTVTPSPSASHSHSRDHRVKTGVFSVPPSPTLQNREPFQVPGRHAKSRVFSVPPSPTLQRGGEFETLIPSTPSQREAGNIFSVPPSPTLQNRASFPELVAPESPAQLCSFISDLDLNAPPSPTKQDNDLVANRELLAFEENAFESELNGLESEFQPCQDAPSPTFVNHDAAALDFSKVGEAHSAARVAPPPSNTRTDGNLLFAGLFSGRRRDEPLLAVRPQVPSPTKADGDELCVNEAPSPSRQGRCDVQVIEVEDEMVIMCEDEKTAECAGGGVLQPDVQVLAAVSTRFVPFEPFEAPCIDTDDLHTATHAKRVVQLSVAPCTHTSIPLRSCRKVQLTVHATSSWTGVKPVKPGKPAPKRTASVNSAMNPRVTQLEAVVDKLVSTNTALINGFQQFVEHYNLDRKRARTRSHSVSSSCSSSIDSSVMGSMDMASTTSRSQDVARKERTPKLSSEARSVKRKEFEELLKKKQLMLMHHQEARAIANEIQAEKLEREIRKKIEFKARKVPKYKHKKITLPNRHLKTNSVPIYERGRTLESKIDVKELTEERPATIPSIRSRVSSKHEISMSSAFFTES